MQDDVKVSNKASPHVPSCDVIGMKVTLSQIIQMSRNQIDYEISSFISNLP